MTTTKVPPPRKLTENEDNDSFDDFWFQVICYYSRDEAFKPFFDPKFTWQASSVTNRGLSDSTEAASLNTLLRALATYAAGPYIRTNILENTTSLNEVKKEFMKYLEIDLTDLTALEWFDIKRRPTERPLVFYMRLKYHMSKHLLKRGDTFKGTPLDKDETLTPAMERFIVMEWLHRLDERLVKFVKEKFSTELNSGSAVLVTMVETLAKNVDHYITMMNNPGEIDAVSFSNPSSHYYEAANEDPSMVRYQSSRGGRRNFSSRIRGPRARPFSKNTFNYERGRGYRGAFRTQQRPQKDCLYCYMEYRNGGTTDYRHPINECPTLSQMYGNVHLIDNEPEEIDTHPYDEAIDSFIEETGDESSNLD